jgi:hypothetical protein
LALPQIVIQTTGYGFKRISGGLLLAPSEASAVPIGWLDRRVYITAKRFDVIGVR